MSSLLKNILVFAGLAGLAYAGYYFFVLNKETALDSTASSEGQILTNEFLQRLNEIQNVDLSKAIFDDQRFRSLVDFSSVPEEAAAGRSNPFSR